MLVNFFQYLTQAAAKVDRCCVVASLLVQRTQGPADRLGQGRSSPICTTSSSGSGRRPSSRWKRTMLPRCCAAGSSSPKSVNQRDELAAAGGRGAQGHHGAGRADRTSMGAAAEERYLKSFPFHPELTEVFYAKWAPALSGSRGPAACCGPSPSPCARPRHGTSRRWSGRRCSSARPSRTAFRRRARTGVGGRHDRLAMARQLAGRASWKPNWRCARQVQAESVGLKLREIEQAVMATFLHSQPTGRSAKTRDLMLLIGPVPGGQDRVGKGAWPLGVAQLLARRHEPAGEGRAVASRLAAGQPPESDADAGGRRGADQRRRGQAPA